MYIYIYIYTHTSPLVSLSSSFLSLLRGVSRARPRRCCRAAGRRSRRTTTTTLQSWAGGCPAGRGPWLRTDGVNTNGAAAKVTNYGTLETKVRPGTSGKIKAG